MTTLTASQMLLDALQRPAREPAPRRGFRGLLARLGAGAQARADRQRLQTLPDHLLRDIGLSRSDLQGLDF